MWGVCRNAGRVNVFPWVDALGEARRRQNLEKRDDSLALDGDGNRHYPPAGVTLGRQMALYFAAS